MFSASSFTAQNILKDLHVHCMNLERDLAERAGQDKIRGQPKPPEP